MKNRLVILTGLSGSGKSAAVRVFEDMGYYCVDNLPVALIPVFVDLCARTEEKIPRIALVIDIREGRFLKDFPEVLANIRQRNQIHILFFEAREEILARRFSETRRPHPMAVDGHSLKDSIRRERQILQNLRTEADNIIDTSAFTVHDLKAHVMDNFLENERPPTLLVILTSFGHKHGCPANMDLLFDVRFLDNPFFVDALKGQTGQEPEVVRFMEQQQDYLRFMEKMVDLLKFLLPLYILEGKSYLRVGIGCTGGKHRSVAAVNRLAAELDSETVRLRIHHRDLEREA